MRPLLSLSTRWPPLKIALQKEASPTPSYEEVGEVYLIKGTEPYSSASDYFFLAGR